MSFLTLALIAVVALAGPLLALPVRWHLPVVLGELLAGILIGAPHTSNWDYVAMLAICWHTGVAPKFLGKKELFRGPMGVMARFSGGILVDRGNSHTLVAELTELVRHGDEFFLVIAPVGTRAKKDYWKSGFYRLA